MMPISIAPLLKQQSQSRHFGHGWIELKNGQRWHPVQYRLQIKQEENVASHKSEVFAFFRIQALKCLATRYLNLRLVLWK